MSALSAASLGEGASLIRAAADTPVDLTLAAVRLAVEGGAESVLLLIESDVTDLTRAMLCAAIGPLAIANAPGHRVNALDLAPGVDDDAVRAAALFLVGARSTTGQVIRVGN